MHNLSPEYLAGFFDGEGSVGLYRQGNSDGFRLSLTISQKDPTILKAISQQYGGGAVYEKDRVPYWRPDMAAIKKFLLDVEPYVIVKKPQVDLAIEYLKSVDGEKGKRLSVEEFDRRMSISLMFKRLKSFA